MLDDFPKSTAEKIQDTENLYNELCAKIGNLSLNESELQKRARANHMLHETFKETDKAKQKKMVAAMLFQRSRELMEPFVKLEGMESHLLDIADTNSNAIMFRDDELIRQEGIASMEIESDLCDKHPQLQPLFMEIDNDLEYGSRGEDTTSTFYKIIYWTITEQLSIIDDLDPDRIFPSVSNSASPEVA